MEIRFYATLRPIVGGRSVALDEPAATVGDLISVLIGRYPDLHDRLLDAAGHIAPFVAVMVNGRDVRHLDGLDTPLAPDDELDIFPPVAGGAAADAP